jgi:MFS family permease
MPAAPTPIPSARVAFSHPAFVRFQSARFFTVLATEMQSVAVGWQVYEITHRPLDLGLVGLAQFLPTALLFLFAGHVADRYDRRKLLVTCYAGYAACSALLLFAAVRHVTHVYPIYAILLLLGVVRSFSGPVSRAIQPQLVPPEHFANAVAWSSSIYQGANILGPALGGLVYAATHGPAAVYTLGLVSGLVAVSSTFRIQFQEQPRERAPVTVRTLLAGFGYIWREKVVLGSISLDMFAVLLGGAVALLPIFASEILHTGPWGLGLLRSAPGLGAAAMAVFVAHKPMRRAGLKMLWCVAGFGFCTILFGLSHNFWLSLAALFLVGALDMVSVIVRAVLIQIATPDEMRGRVNAVDMIFIGTSNELGEFESGLTAHWFGTVPAVVLGGLGTLVVVALWAWAFPDLRRTDRLTPIIRST